MPSNGFQKDSQTRIDDNRGNTLVTWWNIDHFCLSCLSCMRLYCSVSALHHYDSRDLLISQMQVKCARFNIINSLRRSHSSASIQYTGNDYNCRLL